MKKILQEADVLSETEPEVENKTESSFYGDVMQEESISKQEKAI